MAELTQIQELAKSLVLSPPGGIRYSVLVDTVARQSPETPINTIYGVGSSNLPVPTILPEVLRFRSGFRLQPLLL